MILAGIYGWKYIVLFEMNEEAIRHIHMNKQFKKAEAMGWLTALIGAASGHLHTIKLDGLLNHNQIYANGEDYDFVVEYIKERIPG